MIVTEDTFLTSLHAYPGDETTWPWPTGFYPDDRYEYGFRVTCTVTAGQVDRA